MPLGVPGRQPSGLQGPPGLRRGHGRRIGRALGRRRTGPGLGGADRDRARARHRRSAGMAGRGHPALRAAPRGGRLGCRRVRTGGRGGRRTRAVHRARLVALGGPVVLVKRSTPRKVVNSIRSQATRVYRWSQRPGVG
ncbi:hypothetical protein ACFFX0_27085 [Citricoccus parietis]|uniref:Uncharacterized protein n=1 Tax=Citricoccus parietis TaxID=592307 RepID=A0ABV5G6T9_9MICC